MIFKAAKPKTGLLLGSAFLMMASCANAQPGGDRSGSDDRGQRRGPPPEALSACQNLSVGAACSFTGRRNESVSGQCVITPDEQMACKPEGRPPRSR